MCVCVCVCANGLLGHMTGRCHANAAPGLPRGVLVREWKKKKKNSNDAKKEKKTTKNIREPPLHACRGRIAFFQFSER